ncbi:MAG: UDP-3-O-(3-hydroxymyristoyl)glucosamine N-acyltransferase [Gammaproteobacteria bacterium]|jgi:UDP-3-O-[3-hydroxymyristoyl] glucosamine N-acyltransferase|nr:UDP-3-O-(3-hydroxymyristoyl)glucosamine N-acyltransferase [Gammaproteobacteria bacterium]
MEYTLGEIAEITGAELDGDPDSKIRRVSPLQTAEADEISFLANKRHVQYLKDTKACAVILSAENKARCHVQTLVCDDPYLAFARTLRHMHPASTFTPGIHNSAVVSEESTISTSAHVGANVVIGAGSKIADHASIGPGCVIGKNVVVGENTTLVANVTLYDGTRIGSKGLLHPGVVIGADGFGIVKDRGEWLKIPQIGTVLIANDVEIGANSTVDRGALADTVIENGVKLDNQVQIGHGVKIGEHTAIAGCVGVAGSTVIGKRCMIGGHSAISGHIELVDDVIITGMSGVSNSIKKAGIYSSGIPVTENAKWRKNIARFRNLDEITRKLLQLEQRIDESSSD